MTTLTERIPKKPDSDSLFEAFAGWVDDRGLTLYPHQDDAFIELLGGANVILATPTGSGKSLVAVAAHFAALADDRVSFYTAPIKALVSEKFFALCEIFGADNVGMLTGDASVNPDAPIICCTAEILANVALREGDSADIGLVVMDEFHFYSEPERGWAWQVPLLELPQAQFLLMSATLGDTSFFAEDLTRRTGRATATVAGAERPVPLSFEWAMAPLHETLEELLTTHQAPVYVVHFTQAAALERAQTLLSLKVLTAEERAQVADAIGAFRFSAGFGKVLSRLVRHGIGVHHAGMLPKYRRLVETLAQRGLLKVICGTDTLGVGINVPIRTVVFTSLTKFDGTRQRVLKAREFHQIAGRAGRAGFDTSGTVVVQAPDHLIENERALAKAGDDPKKRRKVQRKKPPEGFINYTEETFDKLVAADPEVLRSRMRVTHSMVLNVVAREGDPFTAMRRLLRENHEDVRQQRRLSKKAITLYRELLAAGVVRRLDAPLADGRQIELVDDLQAGFALNQPLAPFALAVLEVLDPQSPTYALEVVSVIEAILEDPFPIMRAQLYKAKGEAVAQMKADGIEYDERMELLEEVTWPQPLGELLRATFETYRSRQPWVPETALSPKSVVREMYENAWTFGELVRQYELSRSEGVVLRYLTDAYRTLRQTVPDSRKDEELDDLIEWLGEVIRQTDSSLLDEWEELINPTEAGAVALPPMPRAITRNERALRVQIRNAMFQRVLLASTRRVDKLAALDRAVAAATEPATPIVMDEAAWAEDIALYFQDHDEMVLGPDSRGPQHLRIDHEKELWRVRQVIVDPDGDLDWGIDAEVPLAASDEAGEPLIVVLGLNRLD
ncbi:DEAD/DEAH box helicase [Calidifontibacter terrae]